MQRVKWNDLQYVLEVAQQGSIAGAARSLGVNQSTVLRRINAFEDRQGFKLFVRRTSGYKLTTQGQNVLATAMTIDTTVKAMEMRLSGEEVALEGNLHLTTTDSLYEEVVHPHLKTFRTRYPRLQISLSLTNKVLNLNQLDADIAIRPSRKQPEKLVASALSVLRSAVYGTPEYIASLGEGDPFEQATWLVHTTIFARESSGATPFGQLPEERIAFKADSYPAVKLAAQSGLGLAVLPCFLGDASKQLQRLAIDMSMLDTTLWLLTHPDLAHDIRVQVFTEFLRERASSTL